MELPLAAGGFCMWELTFLLIPSSSRDGEWIRATAYEHPARESEKIGVSIKVSEEQKLDTNVT